MAAAVYVGNDTHDPDGSLGPLIKLGLFGTGTAIAKGDLLELTANGSTEWVPMDLDFAMSADVAFAAEEIEAGDRTGYYRIMVPRDGDIFALDLAVAGATALGTALYWSAKNVLTVSAGTNIIGNAAGQDHYPAKQGHVTQDASPDSGVTIKSQSRVLFTVQTSNSYFSLYQTA